MKHRRTIKLIRPGLQLKLIVAFLCLFTLALLLQYILLLSVLARAASELPHDGLLLLDGLGALLARIIAISACVILPLTLIVGILTTHRFAGPVYRFKVYLKQVIDGEKPPDCRLRQGDELQDVCALINEATAPLRVKSSEQAKASAVVQDYRAAG